MTDSLTDEELAAAFAHHVSTDIYAANVCNVSVICRACSHRWPCPTLRLISALRASRTEVERLRECLEPGKASAIISGLFVEAERLGHSPDSSVHASTYLVREVERITADRDSWKRMYDIAKERADKAERS